MLVRGELQIHLARHCASLGGKPLELTPAEYELLVILASNPGRAFTRQQLIEKVYGHAASECYATSVTAHLSRLRAKIEPDRTVPYYIRTVKGVGYRFAGIDELS